MELRRAIDSHIADLDRRVQQRLRARGAPSHEAVTAIDVLCAAMQEATELRSALELQIRGVRRARRPRVHSRSR